MFSKQHFVFVQRQLVQMDCFIDFDFHLKTQNKHLRIYSVFVQNIKFVQINCLAVNNVFDMKTQHKNQNMFIQTDNIVRFR